MVWLVKVGYLPLQLFFNDMILTGMILSNTEKNGKLCNIKSSHPTHAEDMSCVRLAAVCS